MAKKTVKKKEKTPTITAQWQPFEQTMPIFANAFRFTWGDDGIFFTIGVLDPEYLRPEILQEKEKIPHVKIIGRFCMGKHSFKRFKEEIDLAYSKMKEKEYIK
jgi:hypothetical protein